MWRSLTSVLSRLRGPRAPSPAKMVRLLRRSPRRLLEYDSPVFALAFAPSGPMLAVGEQAGATSWYDTVRWRFAGSLQDHQGAVKALAYSPDGRWLASGGADGRLVLRDTEVASAPRELSGPGRGIEAVAFSPDGAYVASTGLRKVVRVWRMADGLPHAVYEPHTHSNFAMAFSADGEWLAVGSSDRSISLCRYPFDGNTVRLLSGHDYEIHALSWLDGGIWLVSGEAAAELRVWNLDEGLSDWMQHVHNGGILALATHPGGRYVAEGGADGTFRVWDLVEHECIYEDHPDVGSVFSLAFSPDGKILAGATGGGHVFCIQFAKR